MFDSKNKIWSGKNIPCIYHDEATYGEVVLHCLERNPDDIIQISADDGIELKCRDLKNYSIRVAQNLSKFGIGHKHVAGFVARNTTYLTPAIIGCLLQGVTIATIDPLLTKEKIKYLFKDSKPKIVFVDDDLYEKTRDALQEMNNNAIIFSLTEKLDNVNHIDTLLEKTYKEDDFVPPRFGKSEDLIGAILCSSGTTSMPKGIYISHSQLIDLLSIFEIKKEDICFSFSPLYWISGILMMSLSIGSGMKRLITNKLFDPETTIDLIENFKITLLFLPPAQARATMKLIEKMNRTVDFSSIRAFGLGASVTTDFLLNQVQELVPQADVFNGYGMSEAGGIYTKYLNGDAIFTRNIKLKIVDENGNTLGPNQKGLIMVYPQHKFLGYCGLEIPKGFYEDGWINTGDFGFVNEKNELTIMDRAKELTECNGELICLSHVEAELEQIEFFKEICVVGIPSKKHGNVLAALVKMEPLCQHTKEEILKIVSEKLPQNFQLLGGIYFTDEIPQTPSGKILRRIVREIIDNLITEK